MLNLSLKKLKPIARNRGIKGYKSMSKDKLLSIFYAPKTIKTNKTIKDIRKNSSINEILKYMKLLFETESIKENKTIRHKKRKF